MKNELVVSSDGVNVAVRLNTLDTSVLTVDYRSTSVVKDGTIDRIIIIINVDVMVITSGSKVNLNYATSLDRKVKPSIDLYLVACTSRGNIAKASTSKKSKAYWG